MMAKRFSIKVIGKATQLLGIQITQSVRGIRISQEAYIRRTLDNMGMTSCCPAHIPVAKKEVTAAIQRTKNNKLINTTHFRHIIRKFMYTCWNVLRHLLHCDFLISILLIPWCIISQWPSIFYNISLQLQRFTLLPLHTKYNKIKTFFNANWANTANSCSTSGCLITINKCALI